MWERSKFLILGAIVLLAVGVVIFSAKKSKGSKDDIVTITSTARPSNSEIVAKIGGENVDLTQLVGQEAISLYQLQRAEYEFKMERLRQLTNDRILSKAAQNLNMTTDQFINQKVLGGEVKISDAEVRAFEKEKRIEPSQVTSEMRENIKRLLQQRQRDQLVKAFIAKRTAGQKSESLMQRPRLAVHLERGEGPTLGAPNSARAVVLFSDFSCATCSAALDTFQGAAEKYGRNVRFEFRYRAVDTDPRHRAMAEAAFCSLRQSASKFWKFAKSASQLKSENSPLKIAEHAGVNSATLQECLNKQDFAEQMKQDMLAAERLGLRSSPAFIVDDHYLPGDAPLSAFDEFLRE